MFGIKHLKTNLIPSNTIQMNWLQNIQIEMRKYKAAECVEI